MYLSIKHIVSTSILILLSAAGCYPNPDFDASTTRTTADVVTDTTTASNSSEASGTGDDVTSYTTSGDVTSYTTSGDVTSYTTSYETTEGTQGFDLPLDTSESTVDPGTVTDGTTTSGETTDSESGTMGIDLCLPYDPPQKFEIQVFEGNDSYVQECGTDEIYSPSKVKWIGQDRIRITTCEADCTSCQPTNKSYAIDYPGGDESLKLTQNTLKEDTCTELHIWYDRPEGGQGCPPSAIALKDINTEPFRQYLAVSGDDFTPTPGLGINIQSANPDCDDCLSTCCALPNFGPHALTFIDTISMSSTDDLPEGEAGDFTFEGRVALAKNILATGHDICGIPQQLAWVVSSLTEL